MLNTFISVLSNGNSLNLPACPKNILHLANSFSSRCLVNYSRPLNNWEARKYESFNDAAACIHTRGYSDTSWWGNGTEHGLHTFILMLSWFLLMNFLRIFHVPDFLLFVHWNSAVNVVEEIVWNYDFFFFIGCGCAQWAKQAQFHSWCCFVCTQWNSTFSINEFVYLEERGCSARWVTWHSRLVEVVRWSFSSLH